MYTKSPSKNSASDPHSSTSTFLVCHVVMTLLHIVLKSPGNKQGILHRLALLGFQPRKYSCLEGWETRLTEKCLGFCVAVSAQALVCPEVLTRVTLVYPEWCLARGQWLAWVASSHPPFPAGLHTVPWEALVWQQLAWLCRPEQICPVPAWPDSEACCLGLFWS